MNYIEREAVLDAIATVDAVAGTQTVFRTVENHLVNRLRTPIRLITDDRPHQSFSAVDQFHNDVSELVGLLESDGTYYHAAHRCYYRSPKRIAQEMIDSGISWVTETKVREAQQVKRG